LFFRSVCETTNFKIQTEIASQAQVGFNASVLEIFELFQQVNAFWAKTPGQFIINGNL
jgi:hypothetical protein